MKGQFENPDPRRLAARAAQTASVGLIGLLAAWAPPALAYLGGETGSVSADRAALHGQLSATSMQQYDLHVITAATGTLVHEYTSADNRVFAVTWQGPTPPDLRLLFGAYFEGYSGAATAGIRAGAHRQLSVALTDFVVHATGHARAFRGSAYVPSLVPPGVAVDDLP